MGKKREKLNQAYHIILSIALTWALVLAVNQYYQLRVSVIQIITFSVLPVFAIFIIDIYKKNLISYLILLCSIPFLVLVFWLTKQNPLHLLQDWLNWCYYYNGSEELYNGFYAGFAALSAAIAGAILLYVFTKLQWAKIILGAVIFCILITLSIQKVDINKTVIGISIFYSMTIIVELSSMIYSKKTGKLDKKEGMFYLAPICLILAVLSISFPSKAEPIRWNTIRKVYNGMAEQFSLWGTDLKYYFGNSSSVFSINLAGYSENPGELSGGKVVKNSGVALKISGLDKEETVYLMGSVSNVYTGSRWNKEQEENGLGKEEYFLEYTELYNALARQKLETLENNQFLEKNTIRIKYNNIKTKTFFYPLSTSKYEFTYSNKELALDAPSVTFRKAYGKGISYSTNYYQMNLQGKAFIQMLQSADAFSYENKYELNPESAAWLQKNVLFSDGSTDLQKDQKNYEMLKKYAKRMKSQYSALPAELPERVRKLAQKITKNYTTKYDKLKAIEAFLLNYTYTLTPGEVPENEDFTDYFLFESRKGYCTSFATAMAVLSRCIGVPSRYVEGFVARYGDRDEDGYCSVKNSQAHAWAEAYLEGIGWIPFEATPTFYDVRYNEWKEYNGAANSVVNNTDLTHMYEDYAHQQIVLDQQDEDIAVSENKDSRMKILKEVLIYTAALLVVVSAILGYYFIMVCRYRNTYRKANCNGKMYMLFLRILYLLRREGFALGQQETVLMLAERVKDRYKYEKIDFYVIAEIYMRYRYGECEIREKELNQANTFCKGLWNKQRKEEHRFKMWFREFMFLAKKGRYW